MIDILQPFTLYPHDIIELVFAFIAGFGVLLIWNQERYRSLAVFFLFQAMLMLLNISEQHRHADTLFLVTPIFTLAKGPLLYLFIRAIVNETSLKGFRLYRHFLPMILTFPLTVDPQFVIMLGSISQICYLMASFRLLYRYHRMARTFRSDADELELAWVVNVFSLFTVQAMVGLVRLNLQLQLSPVIAQAWYTFDIAFLCALCCFMLYKVLRQPHLYGDMLVYEQEEEQFSTGSRDNAEAANLYTELEKVINSNYLYREPRLTVNDIAAETGLQMKDISWAINLGSGQNFNGYINRLRIHEVKAQLQSGLASSASVLKLAFAAGFNSKSTFNAVFKREVGMTPTQYIKTISSHRQMQSGTADSGLVSD